MILRCFALLGLIAVAPCVEAEATPPASSGEDANASGNYFASSFFWTVPAGSEAAAKYGAGDLEVGYEVYWNEVSAVIRLTAQIDMKPEDHQRLIHDATACQPEAEPYQTLDKEEGFRLVAYMMSC